MVVPAGIMLLSLGVSFFPRGLAAQDDDYVEGLIAQLDGLREDATRNEFRRRPAVMELLVLGDRAMPALGRAVKSDNWSIRASALYLIASHGNEKAAEISIESFVHDPHPAVRATAVTWCGRNMLTGIIEDFTQENHFIDRWGLERKSLDWLPDDYYSRRVKLYMDILATDEPYENPGGSGDLFELQVKPSTLSAVWAIEYELAGSRGHLVADGLIQLMFRIPAQEENKFCMALEAAEFVPRHGDGSHADGTACAHAPAYNDTLCSVIESRVWGSSNMLVLDRGLVLLSALASTNHDGVRALIAKFANEHPDEAVRQRAGRIMEGREARRRNTTPLGRPQFPVAAEAAVLKGANGPPSRVAVSPAEASGGSGPRGSENPHHQHWSPGWWIALAALLGAASISWTLLRLKKPRLPRR